MSSISALDSLLSSSSSQGAVDLSAILEAATGASTPGIDVTSAVNASVTAAEGPENNWESQQTTLQNQTTALTSLQTDATNVDNDVQALNSLTGPLPQPRLALQTPALLQARRRRERRWKQRYRGQ